MSDDPKIIGTLERLTRAAEKIAKILSERILYDKELEAIHISIDEIEKRLAHQRQSPAEYTEIKEKINKYQAHATFQLAAVKNPFYYNVTQIPVRDMMDICEYIKYLEDR